MSLVRREAVAAGFADAGPEEPGTPGDVEERWTGGATLGCAALCRWPKRKDNGPAGTSWLYAATCHTSAAATMTSIVPITIRSAGAIPVDSGAWVE
jgi:hypothetical protein